MKIHQCFITIIFSLIILANKSGYSQSVNTKKSKILLLHSMKEKRPWNIMYNKSFREAVKLNKKLHVDIYIENLDLLDYNEKKYKDILEEMLRLKYENDLPDIIIITQPTAVNFIFERNLFPDIPKILVLPSKKGFENYPNTTIITYAADFEMQFNHALKIFPETKEVYVVAGNSNIDKSTLEKFMKATGKFNQQVSLKYLTNLDRDSILNYVKNLPEKSFVYYLSYTQDLNGEVYMAKDFSFDLAKYCNRPVFCYLDLLTENTGILGGMVVSLKSTAAITVEFIEKYFAGTKIEDINSTSSNIVYTYDWGEIKKWNIEIEKLPKESIYYNRTYTFFELYKYEVIIGFILLLFYTILLILLLYYNRKGKKSEEKLLVKNEEYEAINEELAQTNEELLIANIKREESISRLHIFINTIPDLIWLKDINGVYLECNNRFEAFFGSPRKDIIGKTDYDFVSKDLADFFRQHDNAAMKAEKPLINEEEITFASDGHKESLETIKTPLYNKKGKIIGVLGIGRDISKRILSEKELVLSKSKAEESEERYRSMVNILPDGIIIHQDGKIVYSNAAAGKIIKAKHPDELLNKSAIEFVHPDFREMALARITQSFQKNIIAETVEEIFIGFDNQPINVLVTAVPFNFEGKQSLLTVITDITNQKLIEDQLIKAKEKAEENEEQLRRIANNFVDGMIYQVAMPDENRRRFNYLSDTVTKLYGCTPDEAKENPDLIYGKLHPEDVNRLILEEKEALRKMSIFKTECRVINTDGSIRWAYYISQPRIINGIVCWDGIEVDITERKNIENELIKAKEKAEESDRLKTAFINNMSHEIRTPMNGILGFSKVLNKANLTEPKRKHYTNIIQNSGFQLMRVIDDILEISQLGTKQVKVFEKETCINDLFLELFSIFDIKAKENKTPLYLKKGLSDQESKIFTDATKLNKILSNLLENALKFTDDGFVEFGYKLNSNEAPAELEIYVKDTGIGISADKQEIVFERFSQEEKELSKNVGGLGLGLSIAKENAELLGGKITLKSEKGKGTTFFVTIPYKPVVSDSEKGGSTDVKEKDKRIKYTILIVEDEEVNYLYIETLLEDEIDINCTIIHAKNGQEAVNMCKENVAISFVLMDLKMPLMSGFEATKLIKEFRPDLPIVAQSAYTTTEDKEKAFSAGCDDFITKPISEETLVEIMNKYLKKI